MKRPTILLTSVLCLATPSMAQDDPVVMTINGRDIPRSEFEYFYSRNNQGEDLTEETLDQYADLFIDFKLKVEDAKAEGIDQTEQFKAEFREYRELQAEDYMLDQHWIDVIAHETFLNSQKEIGPKGLYRIAAISIIPRSTSESDVAFARQRIDSIASCLEQGEDFSDMATRCSEDQYARAGGILGWFSENQLPSNIAETVFSLNVNEVTEPLLTGAGWQLYTVLGKQDFGTFEEHEEGIHNWMKETGLYDKAKASKAQQVAQEQGWGELSDSAAIERLDSSLEDLYPEFRLLSNEFYEGLLMFDISSRRVWDAASADSAALEKFFEKHKSDYSYDKPVFKGIIMFCRNDETYELIEEKLADKPEEEWIPEIIDFNRDSVRVRVMRGPFVEGTNNYSDNIIFGHDDIYSSVVGFPSIHSKGHITDRPEVWSDVSGQVVSDYQDELEKQWIKSLRRKYKHKVYKKVLYTVGND